MKNMKEQHSNRAFVNGKKLRYLVRKHQIRLGRALAQLGLPEYTILTIFAIVMGTAAGFAGVGLHELVDLISHLCFGVPGGLASLGVLVVLIPTAGMLIQSLMATLAPRAASQKGVLEIIKCVGLHNGRLPFRTTLFHFFAPAICIGTGGTVGPEAPAAQAGAGVVSALGRGLGLADARLRVFTAAGAGAAIAAIFNSPLAGVFFAIEVVLLHDFRASALSAFLLASVAASAVARIILGNEPAFLIHSFAIGSYRSFPLYLLMGVGAGVISIAFIRVNEWTKRCFSAVYHRAPKAVGMAAVGLLMGAAGYWQPGIFGIGYDAMQHILDNALPSNTILILLGLKFGLVILILAAGGFGGVFAPSLFLGACFGHLFATSMSQFFGLALDPTAYTLVGMGAVLAGINSVPLTAIMMLFEMTNDYHFMLPLMLGVVGSTLVVQMTLKGSIYARELERQGYHYSMGRDVRILETISVKQVMRKEILTVKESTPLAELIRESLNHPHETIYTTNHSGRINGVILSNALHQLITEYDALKAMVVAKDLAEPNVPLLRVDENLDAALRLFAKYRVEEIPVVSPKSKAEVLGTLHYQDVLNAYNQAKVKLNLTDGLATDIKTIGRDEALEVLPGFSIANVEIPRSFVNKTLLKLKLRNRFDVDVLMIEKMDGPFGSDDQDVQRLFPQGNYQFRSGDRIIVFGKREKVDEFKEYARTH